MSIFTPHIKDGTRLYLNLSDSDNSKIVGEYDTIITDMDTGIQYHVQRADCGAGCRCAAKVVKKLGKKDFGRTCLKCGGSFIVKRQRGRPASFCPKCKLEGFVKNGG